MIVVDCRLVRGHKVRVTGAPWPSVGESRLTHQTNKGTAPALAQQLYEPYSYCGTVRTVRVATVELLPGRCEKFSIRILGLAFNRKSMITQSGHDPDREATMDTPLLLNKTHFGSAKPLIVLYSYTYPTFQVP